MSTNPLAPYDIYLASPKFKLALVNIKHQWCGIEFDIFVLIK
jgi:hypothetical protein